ncbi:hypothetical protein EC957_010043 [Mortierella hygrophila]|uniref:Uncharacterized protein n=1 Tax=Mortierella hygrophila TaxID=979708 RepID=A0A9P6FHI1_9FUNG|nr:hypothetical protein EC957_010043 [Mortierella hygrophila]
MRFASTILAATTLVLLNANSAHAYGVLGHTLTGQIAQLFLTPKTASQISAILPASYEGLLSNAAPWPDKIRFLDQYKWATPMHFVNPPNDNPPEQCLFEYIYGGQDNVNAIFNMTATLKQFQLTPPTNVGDEKTREDALKFFVHFMGDIHQPLHDSTPFRGGNDAPIKFGKSKSNLHSLWDTLLLTKDVKERFGDNPQAYLDDTIKLTKTIWKSEAASWTSCGPADSQPANPWSSVTKQVKTVCPIQWATVTNALDCTYVWNDYSATRDYSTDYFQKVTGPSSDFLYQKLLAQSGIRMAAALNEIFDPASTSSASEGTVVKRSELPPRYKRAVEEALAR